MDNHRRNEQSFLVCSFLQREEKRLVTNSVSPFPWNWEVTELESSAPARSGHRGRAVPGLLEGCSIG